MMVPSTCVTAARNTSTRSASDALSPSSATAGSSLDIFKQAFEASDIMGYVAAFAGRFAWRHGFAVEVKMCGEPGASWSLPERKMVFCYELADDFVKLYKLHGEDPLAKLSPPPMPTSRSGQSMGYR